MATEILRPNGVGSETSIQTQVPGSGAHWDKVDEETPDGATTYLWQDGTTAKRDLYALPNHTSAGVINSVKIYFCCCGDGANGKAKPSLRTNSTTYDGTEVAVATYPTWTTYSQIWTTNPYTNLPWTWDEIDALEIGACLRNAVSGGSGCTQVYTEVDYTAVTAKTATDTGTGADGYVSLETGEVKTSSDTGAGVDGTPMSGANLAGGETASSIDAIIARLLATLDAGYGVEASSVESGVLEELFASELGEGLDLLVAKIEMPTKGGGMKLWT